MPLRSHRTDDAEHIFALIAGAARRASDGQLATAAIAGIAGTAVVALVLPGWWFLALLLLAVGACGIWGIAERTAREREARLGPSYPGRHALATIRFLATTVGSLAAVLAMLVVVARMIGTWIS